ncbi:maleylpyruvate isomerase family mycothiol-dependent enzyme [Phytoactinopolyspora alkaliphila]|uniref:Maleylpyruvate isomerase family mycothiol-dependent enzyme n=1 Tax=Phytoactinopolyspora alkaliphila TaxID=1783498 RepID=A0A6N9YIE3_9ACTN|nr:maleylpyruvate isomerase family mycothiol-dependent enzyme [Phytoactinopolyspora alkaliphila]NED94705.1 maleylpyruvate isomerase family mycothiol-dependent enzyme [Phytoactinopolyspora alkaliphila]
MINQPAALAGGVELLDRSIAYTLGSLQAITPGAMQRRTPCKGWNLRALLSHMDDSLAALCEAADLGRIELELAGAETPVSETISRLKQRACRLLSWAAEAMDEHTIEVSDRALSASFVTTTGALEITVHGWDIAQACGLDRPIPAELAIRLLDLSPVLVSDDDRPARFAAPVQIGPRYGPADQLIAFLGRDPHG